MAQCLTTSLSTQSICVHLPALFFSASTRKHILAAWYRNESWEELESSLTQPLQTIENSKTLLSIDSSRIIRVQAKMWHIPTYVLDVAFILPLIFGVGKKFFKLLCMHASFIPLYNLNIFSKGKSISKFHINWPQQENKITLFFL